MQRSLRSLLTDTRAAVAPTIALSLFGLIAVGGVAFDYARLASMDTELQNAADQAALAAATQLDQKSDSITRATSAAQTMVANLTLMANDRNAQGQLIGTSVGVTASNVIFFTRDDTKPDRIGVVTTDPALARFVSVTVDSRRAFYALTPIVAALNSGPVNATAVAGVGSSVCKVPPLMMCNPAETPSSTNWNVAAWTGRGIRLVAQGPGAAWGPGVFGYLETGLGNGANVLEGALGANVPQGNCVSADSITPKNGLNVSVTDAINTRFDIYESGLAQYCTGTTCSPALNTRKDVIHTSFTQGNGNGNGNGGNGGNGNGNGNAPNCGMTGNNSWQLPSVQYLPDPTTRAQPTSLGAPKNMGFPRDICHAVSSTGDCSGNRIGDGNWDRTLYFQVNHNGGTDLAAAATWAGKDLATTTGPTALSRYDVYRWEQATAGKLAARQVTGTSLYSYAAPQCAAGVGPSPSQPDRRKVTVAVVDCLAQGANMNGNNPINVNKWIEVFLVEPSLNRARTAAGEIYVEIVGEARPVSDGTNMTVRRDVPYLVR